MTEQDRQPGEQTAQIHVPTLTRRRFLELMSLIGLGGATPLLAACTPDSIVHVKGKVKGKVNGQDFDVDISDVNISVNSPVAVKAAAATSGATATELPKPATVITGTTASKASEAPTGIPRPTERIPATVPATAKPTAVTKPAATEAPKPATVTEGVIRTDVEVLKGLFNFAPPVDFKPEVPGGVQNKYAKDWGRNTWNHLMYILEGTDHIDTYATYWGHNSVNMRIANHGAPGQLIAQFEDTKQVGTLVLGVGTLKNFTDIKGVTKEVWKDKKTGTEAGYRPDLPTAIHLKGIVNAPVFVFNADTKELVISGAGNQFGDLTIDLPDEGRVVIVVPNLNDPTKSGGVREVNIVAGLDDYFDRPDKDINRIDARTTKK